MTFYVHFKLLYDFFLFYFYKIKHQCRQEKCVGVCVYACVRVYTYKCVYVHHYSTVCVCVGKREER